MPVPLLDLKPQYQSMKDEILKVTEEVYESQMFILGRKVEELRASHGRDQETLGRFAGKATNVMASPEHAVEVGARGQPHVGVVDLAVDVDYQGRDAGDVEGACHALVLLGIDLHETDPPLVIAGRFLEHRWTEGDCARRAGVIFRVSELWHRARVPYGNARAECSLWV